MSARPPRALKEAPARIECRGLLFLYTVMGSLGQLAGEPSSLSENRHNEFAFMVIVRRINLFELIKHKINFSLGGAFRTHLRDFKFEAY